MSAPARLLRSAAAALRAGLPTLLATAAVGGLAGLVWSLAAQPEYTAKATLIVVDRGELAAQLGNGSAGVGGPDAAERLLELARSDEVSALAASSLGGDVSGADLLARTGFFAGDAGGSLEVRSTASFPDFAAAAANAYAGAVVELATVLERRRLSRAEVRLREQLASLDPLSPEATSLTERIDAIVGLGALGPPVRPGRSAQLPPEPQSERSAVAGALGGAGIGALLAALLLLIQQLYRRPVRTPAGLGDALDAPVLEAIGPAAPRIRAPAGGVVEIDPLGFDRLQALAGSLGLDHPEGAPHTVAVAGAMPHEGRTTTAIGLAAAAATRGIRVLLMEADLRMPVLAERLRLPAGPGLCEYLLGEATPREVIDVVTVAGSESGQAAASFVCVTAGLVPEGALELLAGSRFSGLIEQLGRVYDLVIFDTPPLLLSADAAIVAAAVESTIVCARAGRTRAADLAAARRRLGGSAIGGGVLVGAPHAGLGVQRLDLPPGPRP